MANPDTQTERASLKVLNRNDLTRRLVAKLTHEEAVIGGIGNSNFDLFAAGHRPQNFYMLGSMGLAAPIALEGDGSILMSLGCLATIANLKPGNLTVIIWDNGLYQITGKQVTATGGITDIVAVARAAGIRESYWVRDETHFEQLIDRRLDEGGPLFLAAKIDDKPGAAQPPRDPALVKSRFMKALGTSRGGPLDA